MKIRFHFFENEPTVLNMLAFVSVLFAGIVFFIFILTVIPIFIWEIVIVIAVLYGIYRFIKIGFTVEDDNGQDLFR